MSFTPEMRNFIVDAVDGNTRGPVIDDRSGLDLLGMVIGNIINHDTILQWDGAEGLNGATASTAAPTAGLRTYVAKLRVTDAHNIVDTFNQTSYVTVTLTGGAAGKLIDGVAGPTVYTMVDGCVDIVVTATGAGTAVLSLSVPTPSTLNVADVLTVTFS